MTLEEGAHIATMSGVFVGLATLIYTLIRWRQDHRKHYSEMHLSRKVNEATFWLELENLFGKHDEVHVKLRPGGKWNFLIDKEFKQDLMKPQISDNLRLKFENNGVLLSQNTAVSVTENGWLIFDKDSRQQYFVDGDIEDNKMNVTVHYLTVKEWASVEDYMGLFEHCKILLDKKMLDWDTFMKIFAYRIGNILNNRFIVKEKLVTRAGGWKDFIALLGELRCRDPEQWEKRIERVREWGVTIEDCRNES